MKPRPVTDWDLQVFGPKAERVIYKCPPGMENCEDLELIRLHNMLKMPFVADDRDIPKPEGTIWITVWGHTLPPIDAYVYPSDSGALPE